MFDEVKEQRPLFDVGLRWNLTYRTVFAFSYLPQPTPKEAPMATNLLDLLSNAVSPDIVQGLSRSVGESDSAVRSGVSALLPALLGGLANKSSTPSGAGSVLSMLTGANVDSGLLGTMGNLLGGGQTGSLIQLGTSLLSGLFGSDKVAGLGSALATVSGMKSSSAGSLASLIVPLAFAALKRFIGDSRLDASGLASVLGSQRDNLSGKLDPRLTSALGLGAPASLLAGLSAGVTGAAGAAASTVRTGATTAAHADATAVTSTAAAASGGIGRWLPWIIGAAVLAFLLPQLKNCGTTEKVAAPSAPAVVAPAPAPAAAPASPVAAATSAMSDMKWPAKVYFDTGKAMTNADGEAAIKAVATALAGSAAMKVAITGYTDKTGNADANAKLAKDRAMGVRDALKAAGVAEDRIAMQPPVFVEASQDGKDTEARRVDISVAP